MRVLHFSTHYKTSQGIINQIEYEVCAAKSISLSTWENKIFSCIANDHPFIIKKNPTGLRVINYLISRLYSFVWLRKNSKKYDLILLRHNLGDPFEFIFTLGLKNFITVHHTIELEEAKTLKGIFGKTQLFIEKYLGALTIKRAKGIVCVTPEIADHEQNRVGYEIPYHLYPNAIDDSFGINRQDLRSGVPKIVFIAAYFSAWHGLDILLDSIAKSSSNFELHLVGNCSNLHIEQISSDDRITHYGHLNNAQIHHIANKMDIGIGSLALDRAGMKSACTLKVREYLALGIPVYSGHTDSGLPTDFAYYKNGEVNIENIISFAMEMREITPEIVRSTSLPYISKREKLKELYKWLSEIK